MQEGVHVRRMGKENETQQQETSKLEKGSVESTHKVRTSHYMYHAKHCHANLPIVASVASVITNSWHPLREPLPTAKAVVGSAVGHAITSRAR